MLATRGSRPQLMITYPLLIASAVIQGAGDQDVTIYFRMLLSWAGDSPGSYSAGLEFTALRI